MDDCIDNKVRTHPPIPDAPVEYTSRSGMDSQTRRSESNTSDIRCIDEFDASQRTAPHNVLSGKDAADVGNSCRRVAPGWFQPERMIKDSDNVEKILP